MTELTKGLALEIAHVLFIDIVGYSKLVIDDQRTCLIVLNRIVRETEEFRRAETEKRLTKIPSGDGMALVFYRSPEEPAECALQISRALKEHPELQVRMGVHSGPVSGVMDVNERANVAGGGINVARRVMECGDAGHILLSKHVAEDLEQYGHWRPHLHDLGECEVKHGVHLRLANLYTGELGNANVPRNFKNAATASSFTSPAARKWLVMVALCALLAAAAMGLLLFRAKNAAPAAAALPEKSIAVLPFENLSDDKENSYFADGVQDTILTNLAGISDLKVISRSSVLQYRGAKRNLRDIGRELGVAHVLEGSVQRAAGRVRVSAQLIDTRSDAHLWADRYDRELADVFAIQTEIAERIAQELRLKLSPSERAGLEQPPTRDLAAYDLFLRARALYADTSDQVQAAEKLPQAARLLDEAVNRDGRFLHAWCLLARVHGDIYWQGYDHTPRRLDLAKGALQAAQRIQPDAGQVHLALADYHYHAFRDYGRARAELENARRTLPNNAEVFEYSGYIDRRQGRWDDAAANLERALQYDPRNFVTLQQLALMYQAQRRYSEQVRTLERALTIVPDDPPTLMSRAQVAFDAQADIRPFQSMLATLIGRDPQLAPVVDDPDHALCERTPAAAARMLKNFPPEGLGLFGINFPRVYWEGVVARGEGDTARAEAAFNEARAQVAETVRAQPEFAAAISFLGMIDAALGRKDEALHEGRHACELLPISKDAVDGTALAVNLALIYTWTGEKDLAIEQIANVQRVPNYLSYGMLKLHPYWDPLRGDPHFEQIVAALAPK